MRQGGWAHARACLAGGVEDVGRVRSGASRMHPGSAARRTGVPRGWVKDGRRLHHVPMVDPRGMEGGSVRGPSWMRPAWTWGAPRRDDGCSRRLGGRAHHGLTVHEDGQVRSPARGVRGRRRNRGCAKEPGRDRAPRDIGALGSDPRPERKAARERKRGHVGWRGSPSGPTRDASRAGERRRGARRNGGRSPVPPGIPHRPSNRGFLFSAKAASASRRSSLTSVRS